MKKILLILALGFLSVSFSYAKSISHKKEERFCLPKDISNGFGCVWKVGHRTIGNKHQIQIVSKKDGHPVRDGKQSIRLRLGPVSVEELLMDLK